MILLIDQTSNSNMGLLLIIGLWLLLSDIYYFGTIDIDIFPLDLRLSKLCSIFLDEPKFKLFYLLNWSLSGSRSRVWFELNPWINTGYDSFSLLFLLSSSGLILASYFPLGGFNGASILSVLDVRFLFFSLTLSSFIAIS